MKIENPISYKRKEQRLIEISNYMEQMSAQPDEIDLEKVVELKKEAKEIAISLQEYLSQLFVAPRS